MPWKQSYGERLETGLMTPEWEYYIPFCVSSAALRDASTSLGFTLLSKRKCGAR